MAPASAFAVDGATGDGALFAEGGPAGDLAAKLKRPEAPKAGAAGAPPKAAAAGAAGAAGAGGAAEKGGALPMTGGFAGSLKAKEEEPNAGAPAGGVAAANVGAAAGDFIGDFICLLAPGESCSTTLM